MNGCFGSKDLKNSHFLYFMHKKASVISMG